MIPLGILASSIRTVLPGELLAPTDLAATLVGGLVNLTWTDLNTDETAHRIYRSSSPMDTQALPPPVAELGPNVTEWEDNDTPVDQVAYYVVSAVRGDEEAFGDEVMIDTAPVPDSDPYWDKVVALLHFDDGLHDETGKVFSGGLNTTGGKLVADGDTFIDCIHDDFILGNSNFTIESFLTVTDTPNSSAGYGYILNKSPNAPDSNYRLAVTYFSGVYRFEFGGAGLLYSGISTNEIQPNVEYHVAVVRNGADISIYVNGVFQQSMDVGVSALPDSSGPLRIGTFSHSSYTHGFRGTIDELRITKGVARYTENFTPPTEPFPNVGPPL